MPSEDVRLLAERLRATHDTFAYTDGGWISEAWGFDRGFDSFHAQDQDVGRSVEQVLEYVRHRRERGPWFGFLHTYDVHCPYDPPPPYRDRFSSEGAEAIEVAGRCGNPDFNAMQLTAGQARFLSDRYDEDVRRVDDALGVLFAAFDELDLWKDTVVIVTSDHGEEFLEHGQIGHERTVGREVLAVPLLVAVPGIAPRVVDQAVGLADIVPTVLELAGEERSGRLDGRSLVPLLEGTSDTGRPEWVLSDLAWQVERVARSTSVEHDEVEPIAAVMDPHGLLKLRADMLAAGYKPRPVDPSRRADELRALGY